MCALKKRGIPIEDSYLEMHHRSVVCGSWAKDLLRAQHEKSLEAAARIARHLPRAKGVPAEQILTSPFTLSEAQFIIAREAGFPSWPKLKRHIEAATCDNSEVLIDAALQGDPDFLAEVLSRHLAAAQNSIYARRDRRSGFGFRFARVEPKARR